MPVLKPTTAYEVCLGALRDSQAESERLRKAGDKATRACQAEAERLRDAATAEEQGRWDAEAEVERLREYIEIARGEIAGGDVESAMRTLREALS